MRVTLNKIKDCRSWWDCYQKRFTNDNDRSTHYGVEVTIENGKTTRMARGIYDTTSRYRGRLLYFGTDRYITSPKIIDAIRDCIDGELAIRSVGYLDGSTQQLVDDLGVAEQAHITNMKWRKQAMACPQLTQKQAMELLKSRQDGGAL